MNIGSKPHAKAGKSLVMDPPPGGLGGMKQPNSRTSHTNPPLANNLVGGGRGAPMGNPMME